MSSNSTWRRPLLVLALGLATQAGAQTAPAQQPASPSKPSLKAVPAKPGSGMTANISVSDGSGGGSTGSGNCTVTQDGTVECTGKSSGDGSGDGSDRFYLPIENPQGKPPIQEGVPTGPAPAPPSPGGTPSGDEKLAKWLKCGEAEDAGKKAIERKFDEKQKDCVRDNPDSSGSVGLGINIKGSGFSLTLPADLFTSPAAKRQKCIADAQAEKDTDMALNKAKADSCRVRSGNGG